MQTQYFSNRRSCRHFKKEKISREELEDIIKKAAKAPTCGNMQLYTVIVTEEKNKKEKLNQYHFNQPAATESPVILTICADFNRFSRWCRINNAKPGYDNFHSFIVALTDAVILSQQIVTIAESEGYGTCYLGTVNYNAKEISELLELPELVVPVCSIAIGIPDGKGEETERLPLKSFLHYEKYDKNSDSELLDLYQEKENYPDNKKFVEENGKENLSQVFTDIRYPKEMNEKVSESFMELLKEKNFLEK